VPFTDEFKDKYVAPAISRFTEAPMPELPATSEERDGWLGNFILASWMHVTLDDATRRAWFNFLRRVQGAFRAYEAARETTSGYLAGAASNPDAVSGYFVAIGHWEVFLSQAFQALEVLVRGKPILYKGGDGSAIERLADLYNRSKHIAGVIKAQKSLFPPDGTLPVWLANDGLRMMRGSLSFVEIGEILEGLAIWANAVQYPPEIRERLAASYGMSGEDFMALGESGDSAG
jgi:hypothetical protein